ncbi:Uncharacterized protein Fot_13562 [Forsythia ovata]|uniref:Uncharacterized protein n=1 Tax=Forsythia ovata TaxID=205694 RepID=A0ABD1W3U1_9LAMI
MSNRFETTFLTAWDEFVVNECKIVTTMVSAAPIILARNLRVSSFNGKIPLCQLCGILLYPEAKVHTQGKCSCTSRRSHRLRECKYDWRNSGNFSTVLRTEAYADRSINIEKNLYPRLKLIPIIEIDINTTLNIGENPVRGFMVEEKSAHRTCINKQPNKAYALPVLSPTDPISGRHNAIHTCFKTNTVITSRNITDLRLVANIANQSDIYALISINLEVLALSSLA